MLGLIEEKRDYFPNHSWREFRTRYERLIENSEKAYRALVILESPVIDNLQALSKQIHEYKQRLARIDQIIANGCEVTYINVTKQLVDNGVIPR